MSIIPARKQELFTKTVFGIYFVLLIWLVMFKLTIPPEIVNYRQINLIPFYYGGHSDFHFGEVFYNMLSFIPFGVYSAIFLHDRNSLFKILPVFLTSFLFEILQYVFAAGGTDITDLMMNTLGGLAGILLFAMIRKRAEDKAVRTVNTIGIVSEILFLALGILLYLAN